MVLTLRSAALLPMLAASLVLAAPAAGAEPAATPFATPGTPIEFGRSYALASAVTGEVRQINVLLPGGYDDPKQAGVRYPVLFLLDGGTGWQDFVHIAAMVQQGGLWGANAPMIVVGIESHDRRAEFTWPSHDPAENRDYPTNGKAEDLHRFLVAELKPAIARAYRTNGNDALMGESLAGLFVVDESLRHGDGFRNFIAISPSLWWDQGRLSHEAPALLAASAQTDRSLWLSMADEGGTMQEGLYRLLAALRTAPGQVTWRYAPYHRTVQPLPRLGPFQERLDTLLTENEARHRRDRLRMTRIHDLLQREGFEGSYDAVRRYARRWAEARRKDAGDGSPAFIPLLFQPGEAYQFDWSHEDVEIAGKPMRVPDQAGSCCSTSSASSTRRPR